MGCTRRQSRVCARRHCNPPQLRRFRFVCQASGRQALSLLYRTAWRCARCLSIVLASLRLRCACVHAPQTSQCAWPGAGGPGRARQSGRPRRTRTRRPLHGPMKPDCVGTGQHFREQGPCRVGQEGASGLLLRVVARGGAGTCSWMQRLAVRRVPVPGAAGACWHVIMTLACTPHTCQGSQDGGMWRKQRHARLWALVCYSAQHPMPGSGVPRGCSGAVLIV